jgi:outer membrane protein assembly factor BamB
MNGVELPAISGTATPIVNSSLAKKQLQLRDSIRKLGVHHKDEVLISLRGAPLDWLIDLRPIFLQRDNLLCFASCFWALLEGRESFQIAAMETAGIPLLSALVLTAPARHGNVNAFIIRKERKKTGLGRIIEGVVTDAPVILVDDILNSATSAEKARSVVEAHGATVTDMVAVIDYRSRKGLAWRNEKQIKIHSLFSLADFGLSLRKNEPQPPQRYRRIWQTRVPGGFPFYIVPKSAPVLVDDVIYRGCDAAKMQAFDAATGNIIWEYQATGAAARKGIWSTPAVHEGKLYFGAYNGVVYCLDASSGEEIWTRSYGEWVGASPIVVPRHDLLYIGLEYERPWAKGGLCALDVHTGEKAWERLVHNFQHGSPSYWQGGDMILWGSADHEMLALEAKSGKPVWSFATERSVKYASAIDEARGIVAFASFDKNVYVLDLKTGSKLGAWETGEICYTTPLILGNKLFCGSGDRKLHIMDLDRMERIKTIETCARIYASPKAVGDRVIFGTTGGEIIEIDAETLDVKGTLQLPDAVTNAVAVSADGSRIYVSTYMNDLFAIEREAASVKRGSQPNSRSMASS